MRKLSAVFFVLVSAQAAAGPLAFKAASIKVTDSGEAGPGDIPRNMDNSPGHDNRYDIVANASGVSENDIRVMLQTLLLVRFQMKVHRETKNLDVYALLPGKGAPKFKEAAADEETGLGAGANGAVKFTKQPLWRFTFMLTRRMDRPAIDMTGLKGPYTFTIDLSGLGLNGNPPQDTAAPSVFTLCRIILGCGSKRRRRRSTCWLSTMRKKRRPRIEPIAASIRGASGLS
jgi:Protein of unknown function (DUF3738)